MNKRVAAHKDRRTGSAAEPETQLATHHTASSRAAAAAARVAARFANAPSYNEQLADEARAAVRAAEAASKAALEAQAAAEQLLAGLEAASDAESEWELSAPRTEVSAPAKVVERQTGRGAEAGGFDAFTASPALEVAGLEFRWEPDMTAGRAEEAPFRRSRDAEIRDQGTKDGREAAWPVQESNGKEANAAVESALPLYANLIEFPREIVATRKVRPRRAEGPYALNEGQLSIFEVEPDSISTEPAAAGVVDAASVPAWTRPEWSGIELEAQPRHELPVESRAEMLIEPELETANARPGAEGVHLAPMSRRLMAVVVNGALVTGSFLVAAMVAASRVKELPPPREMELVAAMALTVIAALYYGLFYAFANGTPGMKYAGVSLCTFDGRNPTRAQRCGRLVALVLSVLPVGLGVMWAIFDDDHLSWHDRLSRTYLRKG